MAWIAKLLRMSRTPGTLWRLSNRRDLDYRHVHCKPLKADKFLLFSVFLVFFRTGC